MGGCWWAPLPADRRRLRSRCAWATGLKLPASTASPTEIPPITPCAQDTEEDAMMAFICPLLLMSPQPSRPVDISS